ncbi:hypothetical protein HMPREF9336_00298 [Segniliparus rugosus ATCC BAA-974]|uniref:DUF3137 domain-containing protein n=2 Tax=Segniliparus rugosus TaxID=286804 RepID=E5XLC9_SEGRC|nr:hypothetical protein HMPREF9336_00298 [Segniliparus rugosus ATCC BAA-974]
MDVVVGSACCAGFTALAVISLIGGLVFLAVKQVKDAQRRRQAEMAYNWEFARQAGWRYAPEVGGLWRRYSGPPFGRGDRRRAYDVFSGQHRGRPFTAFEYSYQITTETGSGDTRSTTTTYRFMVVVVATPAWRPTLQVTLEGVGSKIAGFFGSRDLQLESKAFNDRFLIATDNPRFAYDVLAPTTMEWMLADWRFGMWPFRFAGAELATWSPGRLDPQQIGPRLEWLCEILDRTPRFVWGSS